MRNCLRILIVLLPVALVDCKNAEISSRQKGDESQKGLYADLRQRLKLAGMDLTGCSTPEDSMESFANAYFTCSQASNTGGNLGLVATNFLVAVSQALLTTQTDSDPDQLMAVATTVSWQALQGAGAGFQEVTNQLERLLQSPEMNSGDQDPSRQSRIRKILSGYISALAVQAGVRANPDDNLTQVVAALDGVAQSRADATFGETWADEAISQVVSAVQSGAPAATPALEAVLARRSEASNEMASPAEPNLAPSESPEEPPPSQEVNSNTSTNTTVTTTQTEAATPTPRFALAVLVVRLASGRSLILETNGGDSLTIAANGTYRFPTPLLAQASYSVAVSGQPNGQVCTVLEPTGTMPNENVVVNVRCASTPTLDFGSASHELTGLVPIASEGIAPTTIDAGPDASIASCIATPALPAGLLLSERCTISGIPSAPPSTTTHTIALQNSHGSIANSTLTLSILDYFLRDLDDGVMDGTARGVGMTTAGLTLATDTNCDGSVATEEVLFSNCLDLDPGWTPHYSSIVAHFKMDSSVSHIPGSSLSATVSSAAFNAAGKVGPNALDLPTTSSTFQVPTTTSAFGFGTGEFTLAFWVKRPSTSTSGSLLRWVDGSDQATIELVLSNGVGTLRLGGSQVATFGLAATKWSHIALVRQGRLLHLYLNGNKWATISFENDLSPLTSLRLGGASGGAVVQIDDLVMWNRRLSDDEVSLLVRLQRPAAGGIYQSRIFDSGATSEGSRWTRIGWRSQIPYGKQLRAGSETSVQYSSIASPYSATALAAHWTFEDVQVPFLFGDTLADTSGNSRNMVLDDALGGSQSVVAGVLGQGLSLARRTIRHGPLTNAAANQAIIGAPQEFTLSAWVWMYNSYSSEEILLSLAGKAALVVSPTRVGFTAFTPNAITRRHTTSAHFDRWTHLVAVFDVDTDPRTIKLYMNGELLLTETVAEGLAHETVAENQRIFSSFGGFIDDLAVWNATLTSTQIDQLYQRGAHRVVFQVRSCAQSDCSDTSTPAWVGAGGSGTFFSELSNSTINPPIVSFTADQRSLLNQRYLQYRILLGTDATTSLPQISQVFVR